MNIPGVLFLSIFCLFWTGIVGAFDVMLVRGYVQQYRARHFSTASGTVTHSELTAHRTRKGGTSYNAKIRYSYEVGGRQFENDRLRYGVTASSSGSRDARVTVQAHPVGQSVPVYYNPEKPDDSVLSYEFRGSDLIFPLFLTPFNLVMVGCWFMAGSWLTARLRTGGVGAKTFERERRLHVRLPRLSPIMTGAVIAGAASFVSIFVVLIGAGENPSVFFMLFVWAVVLGLGVGGTLWSSRKAATGRADLIIDPDRQTVQLPATFGRKKVETIAAGEISGVTIDTIERRGRKGGRSYSYAVTLECRNGRREKLTDWMDKDRADRLAAWLRGKMAAEEPAAPPKKSKPPVV